MSAMFILKVCNYKGEILGKLYRPENVKSESFITREKVQVLNNSLYYLSEQWYINTNINCC